MKNKMKEQKGITLIALIITIIVMLILVIVTINMAVNGGLFAQAKDAANKTNLSQIQEALLVKKAEIIASPTNGGTVPETYDIELNDLDIPQSLKTQYAEKLTILNDGKLYYLHTNEDITAEEISYFQSAGIEPTTAWKLRGLTSPNVVFDTHYVAAEVSAELGLTFYSDGSAFVFQASTSEGVDNAIADGISFFGKDYFIFFIDRDEDDVIEEEDYCAFWDLLLKQLYFQVIMCRLCQLIL